MDKIQFFVEKLSKEESTIVLTNIYSYDIPQGKICRDNLCNYLHMIMKNRCEVMLIGEAPGYHGCRLSGIPFTCENNFNEEIIPQIMGRGLCYKIYSNNKPEKELSASIVWSKLKDWYKMHGSLPVLWNICPFHPHLDGNMLSNRTPNKKEIRRGKEYFLQLVNMFDIRYIGCVGKQSYNVIKALDLGIHYEYLRHPSCGGKKLFEKNMDEFMKKIFLLKSF